MTLSSKDIHEVEFRAKGRDGYKAEDVDEFLEFLADGVDELNAMVRNLNNGVAPSAGSSDAEVEKYKERIRALENQIQKLQSQLSSTSTAQPSQVAATPAAVDPDAVASATSEAIARTLAMAQRTADAEVQEARLEAARILDEARTRAQALIEESNRATMTYADEAQTKLRGDVAKLEAARTQLKTDADALEKFIAKQREAIRVALANGISRLDAEFPKVGEIPKQQRVDIPPDTSKGISLTDIENRVDEKLGESNPEKSSSASTLFKPGSTPETAPVEPQTPASLLPHQPLDAASSPEKARDDLAKGSEPPKASLTPNSIPGSIAGERKQPPPPNPADIIRRADTPDAPVVRAEASQRNSTTMIDEEAQPQPVVPPVENDIEVDPDPTGQMKYLSELRHVAEGDDKVEEEIPFPTRDPSEDQQRISEFAGKSRFARKKHRF